LQAGDCGQIPVGLARRLSECARAGALFARERDREGEGGEREKEGKEGRKEGSPAKEQTAGWREREKEREGGARAREKRRCYGGTDWPCSR
jgi:hypothetical protein